MFLKDNTIKENERKTLENKLYAPYTRGNDIRDYNQIYNYRTNIQKYDNDNECMQFLPNFIQNNRRDIRLPDTDLVNIESELRGITRNLSKVPQSRYLGVCEKEYNDKGICVCASCLKKNVVNQNNKECQKKIINNHHIPTYTSCNISRTDTNGNSCSNKVFNIKLVNKEKSIMDRLKKFIF